MTDLPTVKIKALVNFPANAIGGAGIDIEKVNGNFVVDLAYEDFAPPVGGIVDATHQTALLWNSVTGAYTLAPISLVGAGGAVPEAPNDGTQYARQSLTWTPVVASGGPSGAAPLMDGVAAPGIATTYSRGDHVHPSDTSRAPLASPVFTGDPRAPTPTVGDNDTSIATTAFVATALASAGTPSNVAPLMDGVAAPGVATAYSRGDHVHPLDTSRQAQDGDLDAIAALSGTGLARRTGPSTWSLGTAIANGELATMAAFTFKGNNTGSAAVPTDINIAALPVKVSPAGGDILLLSDQSASGSWKQITISTLPGASGGITEAPNDGQMYGRQSLGWAVVSGGAGVSPSNVLPIMDGTVSAGISALYSRGDHIHPTDTSRAPVVSPTFTGTPAAPTAAPGTSTTQLATTAFVGATIVPPATVLPLVDGAAAVGVATKYAREDHVHPTDTSRAALASPTFTGDPKAPTPTAGDNDTSIATTAFVTAAVAAIAPATALPIMDSIAAVGVSVKYAREDHVHATDTATVRTVANQNVIGGPSAGGSLTTSAANVLIGNLTGRFIAGGTGENVFIGSGAGESAGTATQNTVAGAEAGSSMTGDTGHSLFGYQAGLSLNSNGITWNSFFGHSSGRFVTDGGSNSAFGRGSLSNDVHGSYNAAFGHAALFSGINNVGVTGIGDTAGGAPLAGDTNWQGTGLTYFAATADTSCGYLGRYTGKATVDARSNAHGMGTLARIPKRDDVMVLGHGLKSVETAGRIWEGIAVATVNANAGTVLSAANLVAGIINRTGTLAGTVTDTTDTAANIVAAGPGQYCEVPCGTLMDFVNGANQAVVLQGGTGVTMGGIGTGVAANFNVLWRIIVTNSTPGSEAVIMQRLTN